MSASKFMKTTVCVAFVLGVGVFSFSLVSVLIIDD